MTPKRVRKTKAVALPKALTPPPANYVPPDPPASKAKAKASTPIAKSTQAKGDKGPIQQEVAL